MKTNNTPNVSDLARWIDLQLSTIIEGVSAGYTLGNYNSVWIDKGATVFNVSLANGETVEIDSDNYNTAEEIATAIISTLNNTPSTMSANETIVTVSVTDNGNKCEYTADGKVLAAITYRKEFDTYDVNTPTVGYMTADVTEAHKACESGVNWLLGHNATFDYSAIEEYNAKQYAAI